MKKYPQSYNNNNNNKEQNDNKEYAIVILDIKSSILFHSEMMTKQKAEFTIDQIAQLMDNNKSITIQGKDQQPYIIGNYILKQSFITIHKANKSVMQKNAEQSASSEGTPF